jgi:proline dehydrogenase
MSEMNFNDTETAFASKTNYELVRDYQVYRLINQSWLVNFGTRTATRMLNAGFSGPIVLGMKPTIYSVFCGGNTLEEATTKINKLYQFHVTSILDYGVEGKEREEDFERTAHHVKAAIDYAHHHKAVDIVSSKFTGLLKFSLLEKLHAKEKLSLEEQAEYDRSVARVEAICEYACQQDVSLFVDAEESWIQDPLDELTYGLMKKYNTKKPIIYNTVQLYRKDRLAFFKQAAEQAKADGVIYAVKLVRGAYMEKEAKRAKELGYEDPIQISKEETDKDYDESLKYAIEHIGHVAICVATHNEESTRLATELMGHQQLPNDHPHILFSQLLGMSDHVTFNLAKAGYNTGKYMPYGPVKDVIPYLIRRAQENTSVSGQMGRELKLLKAEVKRRKLFTF